jgi:hypothetical protein
VCGSGVAGVIAEDPVLSIGRGGDEGSYSWVVALSVGELQERGGAGELGPILGKSSIRGQLVGKTTKTDARNLTVVAARNHLHFRISLGTVVVSLEVVIKFVPLVAPWG